MRKILNTVAGMMIGSFCGAFWISVVNIFSFCQDKFISNRYNCTSIREATIYIPTTLTIYFAIELVIFAVFGIPAYFIIHKTSLNKYISGMIYGFSLGMLGSFAFGIPETGGDMAFDVVIFGVSGIISGAVFVRVVDRWVQRPVQM